jgi:uncharacterized repeat protein (TIGR02543 family)
VYDDVLRQMKDANKELALLQSNNVRLNCRKMRRNKELSMKSTLKFCLSKTVFGIIILAMIIGFVMIGCENPSGGGNDKETPIDNGDPADPGNPDIVTYTVTFHSNGGSAVEAIPAESGKSIAMPANPTNGDYIFNGWYTDNDTFTNAFTNETAVTADVTVFARWSSIEFKTIAAGTFKMGSPSTEANHKADEMQHTVVITKDFYIGKYEVTQKQYNDVMGEATGDNTYGKGDNYPVYDVSWYDAVKFCNALSEKEGLTSAYTINGSDVTWNEGSTGYRLPTEAEWEYACRAGTTTAYSFGESDIDLYDFAWYIEDSELKTHEVGKKRANQWGLYDMHGNVMEWCWDWYSISYFSIEPSGVKDPTGPETGTKRVLRGGGNVTEFPYLRSAARMSVDPVPSFNDVGFRLVRTIL